MTKSPTIKAVILPRANTDGRHSVYLRITKHSKQHYISLDFSVLKGHFNNKSSLDKPEWISKKHPLATMYNELIKKKLIEMERLRHDKELTSIQIKNKVNGIQETGSFNAFWLEFAIEQGKLVSIHSEAKHRAEANKLSEFNKDVKFSQINYDFVKKYETFLLTINKRSTTNKSLSFFKQAVTEAIRRKKIARDQNPFDDFKIKKVEVTSRAKEGVLNIEQITVLKSLNLLSGTHRFHSRNFFLVQLYAAGARVGEILQLKTADIKEDRLFYNMEKKKSESPKKKCIVMIPELKEIIMQYYDPNKKYVFPYLEKVPEPD